MTAPKLYLFYYYIAGAIECLFWGLNSHIPIFGLLTRGGWESQLFTGEQIQIVYPDFEQLQINNFLSIYDIVYHFYF